MGIVWTVFFSKIVTLDTSATESNAFSLVEES